jgi:LysM repeat protein
MSRPSCPGGTLYTIQAGDTFFLLSQRFNVPLDAILAANPGVDPNNLQIGQRVCIPGTTPPPPGCTGFIYVIQAGDTFFLLSQRFNVPLNAIIAANPGVDPNNLQVGQRVCIPKAPAPECSGFIYTVRAGDTLFNLAKQFGVTVKAIEEANPGIDPRNLAIGQKICIPKRRCPQGAFVYVVESGDTLSRIARKFNTTVQAIIKVNPGIDPDDLVVGQQICVPKTS